MRRNLYTSNSKNTMKKNNKDANKKQVAQLLAWLNLKNETDKCKEEIVSVFEKLFKIRPVRYRYWVAYVKFCKEGAKPILAKILTKSLVYDGHRGRLWADILLWNQETGAEVSELKKIYFYACKVVPDSAEISTAYFNIVLKETASLAQADPENVQVKWTNFRRIYEVFLNIKDKYNTFEVLTALLKFCENPMYCEFTAPIQKAIIDDLTSAEPMTEDMWDFLAQRELNGFNMSDLKEVPSLDNGEKFKDIFVKNHCEEYWKKKSLERRIELCDRMYTIGVKALKSAKMVTLHINAMIKLNSDMNEHPTLKRKCLMRAYIYGKANNLLSEDQYISLGNIFLENTSTTSFMLNVFQSACQKYNTVKLYHKWLSYFILNPNEKKMEDVFRTAVKRLDPKFAIEIWKFVIEYEGLQEKNSVNTCQKLLKEACRHTDKSFQIFRVMYLVWCFIYLGIEKTRCQYDTICKLPPKSLELHRKMLELEMSAHKVDETRIRICHENAVNDFGRTDISVWSDYIEFEKNEESTNRILSDAKNKLSSEMFDTLFNSYISLKKLKKCEI